MKVALFLVCSFLLCHCSTDIAEVNALTKRAVFLQEEVKGVSILYSDSAVVKVRITADSMVRHLDKSNHRDEFPNGIFVEFLRPNGIAYSWLEADRATRYEKKQIIVAQGNAKFYNSKKQTITSTELIWDEKTHKLKTNKFVRIVQPIKGDTSYGYGFESNEEFTLFELKRKTSAIFNMKKLKKK